MAQVLCIGATGHVGFYRRIVPSGVYARVVIPTTMGVAPVHLFLTANNMVQCVVRVSGAAITDRFPLKTATPPSNSIRFMDPGWLLVTVCVKHIGNGLFEHAMSAAELDEGLLYQQRVILPISVSASHPALWCIAPTRQELPAGFGFSMEEYAQIPTVWDYPELHQFEARYGVDIVPYLFMKAVFNLLLLHNASSPLFNRTLRDTARNLLCAFPTLVGTLMWPGMAVPLDPDAPFVLAPFEWSPSFLPEIKRSGGCSTHRKGVHMLDCTFCGMKAYRVAQTTPAMHPKCAVVLNRGNLWTRGYCHVYHFALHCLEDRLKTSVMHHRPGFEATLEDFDLTKTPAGIKCDHVSSRSQLQMLLSHTAVVPRTRYTKWQSLRAARPLLPRCMQRVLEGQLDMMGPLRYILAGFIGTCSPDKQQAARDVDYAVDVNGSLRRRDKPKRPGELQRDVDRWLKTSVAPRHTCATMEGIGACDAAQRAVCFSDAPNCDHTPLKRYDLAQRQHDAAPRGRVAVERDEKAAEQEEEEEEEDDWAGWAGWDEVDTTV